MLLKESTPVGGNIGPHTQILAVGVIEVLAVSTAGHAIREDESLGASLIARVSASRIAASGLNGTPLMMPMDASPRVHRHELNRLVIDECLQLSPDEISRIHHVDRDVRKDQ